MEETTTIVVDAPLESDFCLEVDVAKLTIEIQDYLINMGQNAMEIGKRLVLVKSKLAHGEWQSWLEDSFGLSMQTARKFMQIHNRFGILRDVARYSVSQMIELLVLSESDTPKFIAAKATEGTPVEKMTVRKLREEVKKYTAYYTANVMPAKAIDGADDVQNDSGIQNNGDEFLAEVLPEKPVELLEGVVVTENDIEKIAPEEESKRATNEVDETVSSENTLMKLLKLSSELLNNDDLQKLLEDYASNDLQGVEKQLSQLSLVHTKLQSYLENWKNQMASTTKEIEKIAPEKNETEENVTAEKEAEERAAIIATLQQIALNDDANFTKSKRLRELVAAQGVKTVHKVGLANLRAILDEIKKT